MFDLIIIGAGPAGLTAGLYAGRYRLNTVILEKFSPGGQILLSPHIENFPGFPSGISTSELIERMQKQVEEAGPKIETKEALSLEESGSAIARHYLIKTKTGAYETRSIIIASGAQPKRLGVPGEDKFIGRGVSYCGTCDGPLFKHKDVVVVGAGDRAMEEALFLAKYARKVTVVHRRRQLRASRILQERVQADPKIEFQLEAVVEEVIGQESIGQVKIKDVKTGSLDHLSCQGVFIFVGIAPCTTFSQDLLEKDESGFIITDDQMITSRSGIFACGDCRKKSLYQAVNACGEAAVAAFAANKYLLEQG